MQFYQCCEGDADWPHETAGFRPATRPADGARLPMRLRVFHRQTATSRLGGWFGKMPDRQSHQVHR